MPPAQKRPPKNPTPDGVHFARFSPAGQALVDQQITFVQKHVPGLTPEFVKNLMINSAVEFQRAHHIGVEKILDLEDKEQRHPLMDHIFNLFEEGIADFLVTDKQRAAVSRIKERFWRLYSASN